MNEPARFSRWWAGAAALALSLLSTSAQAQISDAQRSAIRSSCRSDFMANCSSVTPGGAEAFQCLKRNESKLSAACRSAVSAVTPAEKPAAAAPATPSPAPVATPVPPKLPEEKPAATAAPPKPATASAPPTTTPSPAKKESAKPSAPSAKSAAAPTSKSTAVPVAPAAVVTGPPAPPPPPNWAQIPPRVELQVVRTCRAEVNSICALPAGGGRILNCLAANQANVSSSCAAALDRARATAQ